MDFTIKQGRRVLSGPALSERSGEMALVFRNNIKIIKGLFKYFIFFSRWFEEVCSCPGPIPCTSLNTCLLHPPIGVFQY